MSIIKIIDDLSREQIPLSEIQEFCTNPVREIDNWHTISEMDEDDATKYISKDQAIYADYQIFALVDDGRFAGAVWFPVTVTLSE